MKSAGLIVRSAESLLSREEAGRGLFVEQKVQPLRECRSGAARG